MLYLRSHEYLKHGTCASGIDCMDSEKGFFSTVLELHRTKMDFAAILASQGIYASHHHTFKVGCLQYTHTYIRLPVYLQDNVEVVPWLFILHWGYI